MNHKSIFLETIKYNPAKGVVILDRLGEVHLVMSEEYSGSTRYDTEYYTLHGIHKINMRFFNDEPLKTMLFEFYNAYAHALYNSNLLSIENALKYVLNNDKMIVANINRQILSIDMACDEFACEKLNWVCTPNKVLPFITVNMATCDRLIRPDMLPADINKIISDKNLEIKYRRAYVEYLIAKHIPDNRPVRKLSIQEKTRLFDSFYEAAAADGYTLPDDPNKKPIPKTIKRKKDTPLREVSDYINVMIPNDDPSFDDVCKRLIKLYGDPEKIPNEKAYTVSKNIDTIGIHAKMYPIISGFLKEYYDKYSKECSMNKREPLKKLIERIMYAGVISGTKITKEYVQSVEETLKSSSTTKAKGLSYLKSWNEMSEEEKYERTIEQKRLEKARIDRLRQEAIMKKNGECGA